MTQLKLGISYDRKEIHSFFGGNSKFTPGCGSWGIQGMLRTTDDELSWVFFVTLNHQKGNYQFNENITQDGVLTWQSQPKLSLKSKDIQDLINFDHDKHNIHLFLRENKKQDYIYLGHLSYLTHDDSREKPVYFEWQLLDWEYVNNLIKKEFVLITHKNIERNSHETGLTKSDPPKKTPSGKLSDRKFSGNLNLDSFRKKEIGDLGEHLVLMFEKQRLIDNGQSYLIDKIEHSSKIIGDGLGYDIKSFNIDGSHRYIEVKTTTQNNTEYFYMSVNELEFAKLHINNYFIYRVHNLNEKYKTGLVYEISGNTLLEKDLYNFEPIQFKINLK